jgi:hypothetical protein
MNEVAVKQEPSPGGREVKALARELAASFRSSVDYYKKKLSLSAPEAVARAEEPCTLGDELRVLDCPPEEVAWGDLEDLARKSPERALLRWEEVKQAALDELRSGDRAARAVEGYTSDAWQRARFLALREELAREWQPRNGVERQLIDQMVQAQTAVFFWQERLMVRASVEPLHEKLDVEERGGWNPPRVSEHQALEQAGAMVDRFNKMYLRTLRALRDLRRYSPTVVVQNAGQVNVGGQQVNVAAGERSPGRQVSDREPSL